MNNLYVTLEEHLAANSGGSGTGMSFYSETCARRHSLKILQRGENTGPKSSFRMQVGTVFHKLAELYYNRQLVETALPVIEYFDDENPIHEALRIFKDYKKRFESNLFTVLSCEELFPKDAQQAAILHTFWGVPYTFKPDMLVDVTQEQCGLLQESHGLYLEPGKYMWDHKTHKQKDQYRALKHVYSMQFSAYQISYNLLNPAKPILGLVAGSITATKVLTRDSYQTYLIPLPDEKRVETVRNYLQKKAAYLNTNECNLDSCMDWRSPPCYYLQSGQCLQY